MFDGAEQHVLGAFHVGAGCLHREELAAGYLLESRSRKHVVDASHGNVDRALVAHVADIVLHLRVLQLVAHVILLFLVAGENADFLDVAVEKTA